MKNSAEDIYAELHTELLEKFPGEEKRIDCMLDALREEKIGERIAKKDVKNPAEVKKITEKSIQAALTVCAESVERIYADIREGAIKKFPGEKKRINCMMDVMRDEKIGEKYANKEFKNEAELESAIDKAYEVANAVCDSDRGGSHKTGWGIGILVMIAVLYRLSYLFA